MATASHGHGGVGGGVEGWAGVEGEWGCGGPLGMGMGGATHRCQEATARTRGCMKGQSLPLQFRCSRWQNVSRSAITCDDGGGRDKKGGTYGSAVQNHWRSGEAPPTPFQYRRHRGGGGGGEFGQRNTSEKNGTHQSSFQILDGCPGEKPVKFLCSAPGMGGWTKKARAALAKKILEILPM